MSTRLIEERHGLAGALGALGGAGARARMSIRLIEERHGVAAVYVSAPVDAPPLPSHPEAAPPAPEVTAAPVSPGVVEPSRSRGRGDWLFFFKPGDWLTRMTDDALLGVVVRVEKSHTFADGSHGPAYAVQSMEGEERVVDADELERMARLR